MSSSLFLVVVRWFHSYSLNIIVTDALSVPIKKEVLRMDEGGRRFARLVKAGEFLFVAGTTGQDIDGARGNVGIQTRRIFEKVKLVLEQNLSSLENVVSMTTYLTDFSKLPEVSAIRNEYMHSPAAGTVVQVSRLDGFAEVEIEFVALVTQNAFH